MPLFPDSLGSFDPIILVGMTGTWPIKRNPDGSCGACGGRTKYSRRLEYCMVCDAFSPSLSKLAGRKDRDATPAEEREKARAADRKAKEALAASCTTRLPERTRRRIALGIGIKAPNPSKVGRDWLESIGQLPDYSIELDTRGRPVRERQRETA